MNRKSFFKCPSSPKHPQKDHHSPFTPKTYADRVGILSRKYSIPFEVCLAIGDNEAYYPPLLCALSDLNHITLGTIHYLYSGIERRKESLLIILGRGLYNSLKIDYMGNQNIKRISSYIGEKCKECVLEVK